LSNDLPRGNRREGAREERREDTREEAREELVRALIAANRRYQQGTDALDGAFCDLLGIHRTDARCMDIILQRDRISAGELAVAAGLSPGAVTAAVDRLERAGFGRRVRDPVDRRRVLVEATELARDVAEQAYGPLRDKGLSIIERLSDRQIAVITQFLEGGAEIQLQRAAELREQLERDGRLSAAPAAEPPPAAGTSAG
jgi:DNA-binding MarR family transcriptional regulator